VNHGVERLERVLTSAPITPPIVKGPTVRVPILRPAERTDDIDCQVPADTHEVECVRIDVLVRSSGGCRELRRSLLRKAPRGKVRHV
jgi:hypothetical protein